MARKDSRNPNYDPNYEPPLPPPRDHRQDANFMLLGAMAGISTDALADTMDRQAQARLQCAQDVQLPIRGSTGGDYGEAWAAMGVVFGEPVDGLFRKAKLPKGWVIRPTDHPMHSDLLDDKGRKRARIFYKSAFWDRDAYIDPEPRFTIGRDYDLARNDGDTREQLRYRVRDCDRTIFETEIVIFKAKNRRPMSREDFAKRDEITKRLEATCKAWLIERYPNYEKIAAHWDDP